MKRWTSAEITRIKELWPRHAGDWGFWEKALPSRSPDEIRRMASNIRAFGGIEWTPASDLDVLAFFSRMEAKGYGAFECAERYDSLKGS
jgi:hypothetical protein